MQLGDLFDPSFRARRDQVALEVDDPHGGAETLTFGGLDARANRMARALAARGVVRGDRVALQLGNSMEFVDVFLACVRLGAIFVPINVLYREREVAHILGDAEPRLTVTSEEHLALVSGSRASIGIEALAAEAAAASDEPVRVPLDGDDPLAIVYTSGTTGRSKGALLSHNNFAANTVNLLTCWRITSDDRYLAVLPLFHVHGLANGLCCALAAGCRTRLAPRFELDRAPALFETFRPTLFFGVPTIYVRLLEFPPAVAGRIGAHMRLFVSGSAPLPAHVLEAFRERFGHTILERYGMSETLMLISNPYEGERRPGTVGLPLPGVSARIERGELLVRGSNVFSGYWRNPEATAAAFTEGWFHTGDLAERSEDGWYTLRGRATDLIISGGFNVYPREVEEVLLELPGVREAAVVGAPDERRGEVPVAYVVTDAPLDAEALRAACGRALASFKVPRAFVRMDALPRNALGKVQKHLLGKDAPAGAP
ncbi:MAG TPA: AMP-binding protein [Gemmatimonadaceae bacterium]|nr:AMP-binding protein [Gemmatimonadaceae bacterium]